MRIRWSEKSKDEPPTEFQKPKPELRYRARAAERRHRARSQSYDLTQMMYNQLAKVLLLDPSDLLASVMYIILLSGHLIPLCVTRDYYDLSGL